VINSPTPATLEHLARAVTVEAVPVVAAFFLQISITATLQYVTPIYITPTGKIQ